MKRIIGSAGLLAALMLGACANSTSTIAPKQTIKSQQYPEAVCKNPLMDWGLFKVRLGVPNPKPLGDYKRRRFLSGYNSLPPKSNFKAQEIYIFGSGLNITFFFVSGVCVTHIDVVPTALVHVWLTSEEA